MGTREYPWIIRIEIYAHDRISYYRTHGYPLTSNETGTNIILPYTWIPIDIPNFIINIISPSRSSLFYSPAILKPCVYI